MGTLTKEQITAIEYELASPFGRVVLACDSYKVTVAVEQKSPRKYELMVYVNDVFKAVWTRGGCEEATRFLRPTTVELFKPAQKSKILKDLGKRHGSKFIAEYNKTSTIYLPIWQSVRSMVRHFCKHCESVSVTSIGYAAASASATSKALVKDLEPAI
ncbi:hypothetical protein [Cupriavidus pauculus]|uniref:hypothetical protein n=1 Tax=Cupriavidus pauculus TaxID=82633 RepID=UPI00385745D8